MSVEALYVGTVTAFRGEERRAQRRLIDEVKGRHAESWLTETDAKDRVRGRQMVCSGDP